MSEALARISSISELEAWGDFAQKSGVIPSNCNRFQAAAIVQTGRELGLAPLQSLRAMCFVNGRLTLTVQLQLALAKNKGVKIIEMKETETSCTVTMGRDGEKVTCEFNHADAEKAGLATKDNWKKYGRQMYRWRAIGDALRLIAPDLVMGLLDPIEAASIDAPQEVEAKVADPVGPSPAVEKQQPPPPAVEGEKKDLHTLINELKQLAEIAVDAGKYKNEGDAVFAWTSYRDKKSGEVKGFKAVTSLKHEWQATSAITRANDDLNAPGTPSDDELAFG